LPINWLRVFLYRNLMGYRIVRSRIGWGTIIDVEHAELTECLVGRRNQFFGPMKVVIESGAHVGNRNVFNCGWWTLEERFAANPFGRSLYLGRNTLVTSHHHFDVAGTISIGDGSWIAGAGSQFWTHGAGSEERNIAIGERCYIGSASLFAPSTAVGDNCLVGLGSVMTKPFPVDNAVIAGQPASVIRENYDWKTKTFMRETGDAGADDRLECTWRADYEAGRDRVSANRNLAGDPGA
jgi:acetyltransferase-like isoleucine patch superfamily enzyme